MAAVYKLFCVDSLAVLSRVFHFCLGHRVAGAIEGCADRVITYCLYRRNPLLQLFYLGIVLGAYGLVVLYGYPMLPCHYMPLWHRWTAAAAVGVCLYLWWLACTVSPGLIEPETLYRYAHNYVPDKYLYPPGRLCPTVGIVKPARSKFCKLMGCHVARFDHFCPWLNQAVGMENYRYFLAFLFAHCLLLGYGSLGMAGLLLSEVHEKDLWNARFFNSQTGRHVTGSWRVIGQYLMHHHWGVVSVFFLCGVMSVVLLGFTLYHLYLAARNEVGQGACQDTRLAN